MHSSADDSRQSRRSPSNIGLTVAALTGAAVLAVIGARALNRNSGSVGRRFRRILDALTNDRLSAAGDDDAAYAADELVGRTVTINRPRHELYAFSSSAGNPQPVPMSRTAAASMFAMRRAGAARW
jgi:hypothetical protein